MVKVAFRQRLERVVRGLTPFALTLLLVVVSVLPVPVPGFAPITPALALISVYYWSIYRPDLLPMVATFFVGLVQDALSGLPLGLTALVFLLVRWVVVSQRRFFLGKSFVLVWWGFMLVAPAAVSVSWALASLILGGVVAAGPVVGQLLLTVMVYPALTWLLARTHPYLPRRA
ncbi:MAG: rod shape-determining protein MreD [Alphaproteobacteria bacterium]